jgi:hypothetical protein
MKKFYLMLGLWAALFSVSAQNVATFESIQLDSASWWNGSDGSGGFNSGGVWFPNDYNHEWGSWSGFSVSNMQDSTTAGWSNQYSAITASGVNDSENYAVVYTSGELTMEFDDPVSLSGFYVTNATYTYLAMKNGDDYSKKFGGPDGTDPDYFKLVVSGTDINDEKTEVIEFYLADFTADTDSSDYILKTWEWVDLSNLGVVKNIQLKLESSDVGDWGMNTPAYFCIDNFTVAEITSSGYDAGSLQRQTNVYPNPFKNDFQVDLPETSQSLFLTDLSGKILFRKSVTGKNKVKISALKGYPHGTYFLMVETPEGNISRKIIKF